MSAQGYDYWTRHLSDNKEAERLELKAKRDEAGNYQVRALLASVMPSSSDRIIDWRRM
jgi:hypothetical protein